MARHFAFLRAINVGGRTVQMSRLRQLVSELGLQDVETFIASGNVIFLSARRSTQALERSISTHLATALGFSVETFVRTGAELRACLDAARAQKESAADLQYVGFLHAAPSAPARGRLSALASDADGFAVAGREIYWLRRGGAQSPYSGAAIEKALGMPTTLRNIRTIERMVERYLE